MVSLEAKRKRDRIGEIIAYALTAVIWCGGLVICVLGVYAYNAPGKKAYNDIYQAQKNFSTWLGWTNMVDFRILGSFVCLLAMCLFLCFVNGFANRYEKDIIRRSRQEKKLQELLEADKKQSEEEIAQAKAQQIGENAVEAVPQAAPVPKKETGPSPVPAESENKDTK